MLRTLPAENGRWKYFTVRSAPKFVSYTSSNPICRRAATRRPSVFSPFGIPNLSPIATRTAGAICATTLIFLSANAFHTGSTSCRILIAPVGQTALHCPQPTQSVSASSLLNAGITCIFEPRKAKSRMPSPWISSQVRTQSPQRIHLLGSLITQSEEVSSGSGFL